MSQLYLQQHDPKKLAAGYSKSFRLLEVVAILSFWALSLLIALKAAPFRHSHPWVLGVGLVAGFLLADFVSGFVHWLGDTWGSADMPILGKALVRPFREHHIDQKAITRHDYIETNGANCLLSVPVAAGALCIPLHPEGLLGVRLFALVSIGSMIFWVMLTNQIHKWAHLEPNEIPAWIRALQRLHLILPPEHHRIHHTPPFDKYYSITTGWMNWPLTKVGFFRRTERLVTALFGLIPRKDDLG